MDFFDAQDRARRSTRWLVVVYILATALIVIGVTVVVAVGISADPFVLAATALITVLFIIGASMYKTARLSAGGGRVARDMGGTLVPPDVHDPLRRRLRNIVEEMSIASGVPVPEIYVLENEPGINAFAAGFAPGDAAVAVTRGTLELLNRDELQGVIAHEFSHILNGDMRLNIRLMGVLFGILVLGLMGRIVIRGGYHSSLISSRRSRGAPAVMMVGLGLAVLGWIGVFFARIIKAAVSRQREFLADASAVQFTRQSDGIANALRKIGGYTEHSYISATDPEEISHMLFARGVPSLRSLFATHPPLAERIRAIDPNFREGDYLQVDAQRAAPQASDADTGTAAPIAAFSAPASISSDAAAVTAAVGNPDPVHVAFARRLRKSIPAELYDAAHSPDLAYLLNLALVLNDDDELAERQVNVLREQLGDTRASLVERYRTLAQEAGPAFALPLLEISFPMLKQRPVAQLEFLVELTRRLVELDGHVDIREFCFLKILVSQLVQARDPAARPAGNRVSRSKARRAALRLLRIVADLGHADAGERERAFRTGAAQFGAWANDGQPSIPARETIAVLDHSLDVLRRINGAGQRSLVQAVTETVSHDGRLTIAEAELLRAICAALDCPLPPILAKNLE
jgi:Zn-dependent protease with chaperone function